MTPGHIKQVADLIETDTGCATDTAEKLAWQIEWFLANVGVSEENALRAQAAADLINAR